MSAVRYLVDDIDVALPFYTALGFRVAERRGPPFAIVERDGLALWLSGPGTSARRELPGGAIPAPGGWNRLVLPVELFEAMDAPADRSSSARSGDVVVR